MPKGPLVVALSPFRLFAFCTTGDTMADLVSGQQLGRVVGYRAPDEVASAIMELLSTPDLLTGTGQDLKPWRLPFPGVAPLTR